MVPNQYLTFADQLRPLCVVFYEGSNLDSIEESLVAGKKILVAFFCTFPRTLTLKSPDLERIHNISIKHDFIVICDDSIASIVDFDLFPYVDVRVTSLTKSFSGGCDVAGGSVVINLDSQYSSGISRGMDSTQDTLFPDDALALLGSCQSLKERVSRYNSNALSVVRLLESNKAVNRLYHPS